MNGPETKGAAVPYGLVPGCAADPFGTLPDCAFFCKRVS